MWLFAIFYPTIAIRIFSEISSLLRMADITFIDGGSSGGFPMDVLVYVKKHDL
jgi:hypothetical protein